MQRLLSVLAILCLLATPVYAASPTKQLHKASKAYSLGQYPKALKIYTRLKNNPKLTHDQRVYCLKYRAYILFLLGQEEEATTAWLDLLDVQPGFAFDPVRDSPKIVEFFSPIRRRGEPEPAAPDETSAEEAGPRGNAAEEVGPRGSAAEPEPEPEPEPKAEPEPEPEPESESKSEPEPDPEPTDEPEPATDSETIVAASGEEKAENWEKATTVAAQNEAARGCGIALCLIPFGVGQFANENYVRGAIFAALEVGIIITIVALQVDRQAAYDANPNGFDSNADVAKADTQSALFYIGLGTVAAGIAEAFIFP